MARTLDRQFLRTLTPLDSLKPEHQVELGKKSPVQTLGAGRYLFREGDKDNRTLYVISGEVELRKGDEVVRVVAAGTPEATRPLAQQTPRPCSARARSDIEFIAIDSDLLDIMLTWHQTGSFEVGELHAGEDTGDDWMAVILQTRAFHRIPPANIQAMFLRMQPVQKKAGEVVIKQGEEGDYFYIVTQGRCLVTRETPANRAGIKLAELGVGDTFGEEALISDAKRNATVTMLTDGQLMRLAKQDFNTLLNEPMLNWVSLEQAKNIVASGGQWLDVRLPSEFESGHPEGAINLPLYFARLKLNTLDPNTHYVAICDTGRRSSAAAYILSERGFSCVVLKGGWSPEA